MLPSARRNSSHLDSPLAQLGGEGHPCCSISTGPGKADKGVTPLLSKSAIDGIVNIVPPPMISLSDHGKLPGGVKLPVAVAGAGVGTGGPQWLHLLEVLVTLAFQAQLRSSKLPSDQGKHSSDWQKG